MNTIQTEWLHYVRDREFQIALKNYHLRGRVLEIGGGDGWLTQQLIDQGYAVISIDTNPKSELVVRADAQKLPFPDASFDMVFSCHVIAHIENKELAFAEMRRVLRPGGVGIHVVPSPWWSLLTNVHHALRLPRMIAGWTFRKLRRQPTDSLRSMILHPLGANPSFVHELVRFSVNRWERLFQKYGFQVFLYMPGPLLQSGYRVFPFKAMRVREVLGNVVPSSYCFMTYK